MRSKPSRWTCKPYDVAAATRLSGALGLSSTAAAVLVRRGLSDVEEARNFLAAADRHDPLAMDGMDQACGRILSHVERGTRIVVFGDYDVDGVCSTAILARALRALGADPGWRLPSRFEEGYGLSLAGVEQLVAEGTGLLITVDCGVTAVDEVAAARAAGIEVVVTDHHRPGQRVPDCPVVHPGLGGYPCPELCASGVVLKLSEALLAAAGRDPAAADEDLDLAALATVCDLVPLRGENRRIVREGLSALARTRKPGLRALMEVAGLEPAEVSEQTLGYRLGPRLNAAGRMQRADAALELLMTDDPERAAALAQELDALNHERRETETGILFAAEAACARQASSAAIVVAAEGWHPGVVGIVASRLVERWRRPCVVIALAADGSGRGSGRSISAYDLHAGLSACSEHLGRFGGHRAAAGMELRREAVEPFRSALAAHAGQALTPQDLQSVERVDAVVPGGALGLQLAEELERLRPCGMGNPQPTLLIPAARVESVVGMGEESRHARFTLVTGGSRSRGVVFGEGPRALAATGGEPHDLAVRVERNRWKGKVEPRVVLRAACPTVAGELRILGEDEPFWTRVERELDADPAGPPAAPWAAAATHDRRGEGFAGVVGDLLSSGERVAVAVADVPRRRAALEKLVAGLADDALAVVSWAALLADPGLVEGLDHLVALDPPQGVSPPWGDTPGRNTVSSLSSSLTTSGDERASPPVAPLLHLAWGPAEVDFALAVWRSELELRPAMVEVWRALSAPDPKPLEAALRGQGPYPRSPECCGRLIRVLSELGLVEYTLSSKGGPACRPISSARADIELSLAYRAYGNRLAAAELALADGGTGPAATGASSV